jgi:hypothetical protein
MPGRESLPLNCAHCGRPIAIRYKPSSGEDMQTHLVLCPYSDCQKLDKLQLFGTDVTVTTDVFRGS